ncbi:MAG: delta-aminolevulinic acid dehydratase [Bacteroidetes bacterium GWA2_32_17]|nr:MAG: delta-aminolevulinic acid dehydratase [Bacteroidetes bacterium GWA2_32_17]
MHTIIQSFNKLKNYCEKEDFRGWDPYDGLNSRVFRFFQMHRFRILRLAWIQLFKRSHINFRKITLVDKGYNPKGLGLFLTAYCNIYKTNKDPEALKMIHLLAKKILGVKSTGYSGSCWGYNFDWQSRLEYMPKYTPTIVATSFVACSLLDAYDCTGEKQYYEAAESSCKFILNDLNRTNRNNGFIFSYSPLDNMRVYNASLLGSKLLARVYSYNKDLTLYEAAKSSVIACVSTQRDNGSWLFGEDPIQNWVDSFHTGYKLESISEYMKYTNDRSFEENVKLGFDYYMKNFFLSDGTPKYYDNKTYPIDIHCPAQLFTTLFRLGVFKDNKQIADKVMGWMINNMQDKKSSYFYYQINPGRVSRIPYMRWGQAWVMYGMSFYFLSLSENNK